MIGKYLGPAHEQSMLMAGWCAFQLGLFLPYNFDLLHDEQFNKIIPESV